MPREETIQGLERGLAVLSTLRARSALGLQELHASTGVSKPSLLRVLRTLTRHGLVHRRLADSRYVATGDLFRPIGSRDRHDRVADAAAPVLERLRAKLIWPSDLIVPAGDHMEIRETSRTLSPFRIDRDRIGHRVNFLLSAVGRAYLAFCPTPERARLLARLRRSGNPENRLAFDEAALDRILTQVRRDGYATRDPSFAGGYYGRPPYSDGLAAIAVALAGRRRVYGCINLVWVKEAYPVAYIVNRHLPELQAAAAEIVAELDRAASRTRRTPAG